MLKVLIGLFLIINLRQVHASESEEERYEQKILQSFTAIDLKIAALPKDIREIISNNFSEFLKIRLINKFFENLTRNYIQENFVLNLRDFKISKNIKYYEPLCFCCNTRNSHIDGLRHMDDIDHYKLYCTKSKNYIYFRSTVFSNLPDNTFNYCEHTVLNDFVNFGGFLRPKHVILYYTCNIAYNQIAKFVENNPQIISLKLFLHDQERERTVQIMEKIDRLKNIQLLNLKVKNHSYDDSNLGPAFKIPADKVVISTDDITDAYLKMLLQNPKLTSLIIKNSYNTNISIKNVMQLLFNNIKNKPLKKLEFYNLMSRSLKTNDLKDFQIQKLKMTGKKRDYSFRLNNIVQNNYLESFAFHCKKFRPRIFQNFVKEKRQNFLSKLKKIKIYYSNEDFINSHEKIMNILGSDFEISFKKI